MNGIGCLKILVKVISAIIIISPINPGSNSLCADFNFLMSLDPWLVGEKTQNNEIQDTAYAARISEKSTSLGKNNKARQMLFVSHLP